MPKETKTSKKSVVENKPRKVVATLAEIRLENFKSVVNATVELRPLTVVVGRNSSGKSTLLQSVLALAQVFQNRSNTRKFPLNGNHVRLGTFDEVLNFQNSNENAEVVIGFSVTHRRPTNQPGRTPGSTLMEPSIISWTGHLVRSQDNSSGSADLSSFVYEVVSEINKRISLDISHVHSSIDREGPYPIAIKGLEIRRDRAYLHVDGRVVNMNSGLSNTVDLVSLSSGLPVEAFRNKKRFEVYARKWWDAYVETLSDAAIQEQVVKNREQISNGKTVDPEIFALQIAEKDFARAAIWEEDMMIRLRLDDIGQTIFKKNSLELPKKDRLRIIESLANLGEAEFRKKLEERIADKSWCSELILDDVGSDIGGDIWSATHRVEILFRDLQYLGPLREAPQVLYVGGASSENLGPKGEYSASVFHARREHFYMVPLPDGSVRRTRLGVAVNQWLIELGLADEAKANDLGRLGIGLTISPVGSGRDVDLTSVGVGVSQILPVLLACLLARSGSLVLIEQPELHLHPAMQLRLADFLLACARSGRQIMIETHSEHLVNRLRLHVAQDETSTTGDLVQLLFAEQEDGVTSYRTSQINPLGGLSEDWPRGFLDVGSDEAGQLLRQTVLRQRQISSKKD